MRELKWSPSEKKVARRAFDAALDSALTKVMAELKLRANAATKPADIWEIEDYLRQQRREIDATFDYRYSQLPLVFARLIHKGHLDESRLAGLSEDKREIILSLSLFRSKRVRAGEASGIYVISKSVPSSRIRFWR